jgi:uncharacterized membrane protein YphA (DoxX/SURF4 family)
MSLHLGEHEPAQLPAEAVKASAIAFLRIWLGIMWLFEVTVGHNWKIGGFASGGNPRWMGSGAGDAVREESAQAIEDGTYSWFASLFDSVIVPNAVAFSYIVIVLQIALGVAFIIGLGVRPMALAAIAMDVSIFMLGNSRIPPFFTAMHLFVLFSGAGTYYGLDGWILEHTRTTKSGLVRAGRWLIELPVLKREYLAPAIAGFSVLGVYFFLTMGSRATPRFAFVAMELAALAGLVALGLFAYSRSGDRLGSLTAALRIFVGFKILHEIWARTTSGVNALPGWASVENQTEFYETIVENHWSFFANLVDALVLPAVGFWVVLFGIVQFVVGVALVVGYRTRLFGLVALGYLTVLIGMGFTRLAPFLFGLLVVTVALDGGRLLSLDRVRRPVAGAHFGLPIPPVAIPALVVLAAINAVAAAITAFNVGITPDAYVDSMPAMVTAFVAIISGTLAFAGWLQQHPSFDHSGELVGEPAVTGQEASTDVAQESGTAELV